jgi:hypothetical protein
VAAVGDGKNATGVAEYFADAGATAGRAARQRAAQCGSAEPAGDGRIGGAVRCSVGIRAACAVNLPGSSALVYEKLSYQSSYMKTAAVISLKQKNELSKTKRRTFKSLLLETILHIVCDMRKTSCRLGAQCGQAWT